MILTKLLDNKFCGSTILTVILNLPRSRFSVLNGRHWLADLLIGTNSIDTPPNLPLRKFPLVHKTRGIIAFIRHFFKEVRLPNLHELRIWYLKNRQKVLTLTGVGLFVLAALVIPAAGRAVGALDISPAANLNGSVLSSAFSAPSFSGIDQSASSSLDGSQLLPAASIFSSGAAENIGSAAPQQVLASATAQKPYIVYTVKSGDVLSLIAQEYNVSLNSVLASNNLSETDYIQPGQQINIPAVDGVLYTVRSGNTLAGIVSQFNGSLAKTITENDITNNTITPGDQILIVGGTAPQSMVSVANASYDSLTSLLALPTHGIITQGLHPYNAVDIGNNCGTPVYAAQSGTVYIAKTSGWNGGYGHYVKIDDLAHALGTLYAHFEKIFVVVGQHVNQGDEIGLMGETGNATGCHLHFEVHGAVNPIAARYSLGDRI